MDGGGIKGLIAAAVLAEIEEKFHPKPIYEIFDFIVGTSTGGIIAAMLTIPKKSNQRPFKASEILDFYKTHGSTIFFEPKNFVNNLF